MNFILVILSLVILIVIHEFGHFIFAKKYGVRVDEFGVGIPPRLFGKKIGETIYSLNMIPLGGFVRLYGEDGASGNNIDEDSFAGKPIYQRAIILFAGVASFFVISAVVFSIVSFMGVRIVMGEGDFGPQWSDKQIVIVGVSPSSPAEKAGIKQGDYLSKIDGEEITSMDDAVLYLSEKEGQLLEISVTRESEEISFLLTPRTEYGEDEGAVGIKMLSTAKKRYPLYAAPVQGVVMTGRITKNVVFGFSSAIYHLFSEGSLPPGMEVGGPVKIVEMGAVQLDNGFVDYLYFVGLISISLAVLNIIPIPALDGGRLLFLGVEKVKGSAISPALEKGLNAFFFLLLITLMIFVTFQDIKGLL